MPPSTRTALLASSVLLAAGEGAVPEGSGTFVTFVPGGMQ